MRLAIAHHDARILDAIKRIVAAHAGYDIIWIATDGAEAAKNVKKINRSFSFLTWHYPALMAAGRLTSS